MKINQKKLEILRAEQELTLKELSKKSSVNLGIFFRIGKGANDVRPTTVGKIAKALNVPVIDLIED